MLLRRERTDVVTAIERLAALQAQWPRAPYVGLWTRLAKFDRDDLEAALRERTVLKATLMRGTLHLASARDYPAYALAAPEARRAAWPSTQATLLRALAKAVPAVKRYVARGGGGIADAARFHERLLRHAAIPRSKDDLIDLIVTTERIPRDVAQYLVWQFIAAFGMVVHVPESGLFSANRAGDVIAARVAMPALKLPPLTDAVVHTVRRYLAAFGPSTVDDVSSWTSIRTPPIREAIATLGSEVRGLQDERGRTLYDLAKAPRPDADVDAPVRFLPKWDSTLLAYTPAERVRILPAAHRKAVIIKNGDVAQTVLVDGMVAGTWSLVARPKEAVVEIRPFGRIARADKAALIDEGERLARFLAPDAPAHGVRV
jgi:hypothetical protein